MGLVDLEYVKTALGIDLTETDDDLYLQQQIDQISARVEQYCQRTFARTVYDEQYTPSFESASTFVIENFPILEIGEIKNIITDEIFDPDAYEFNAKYGLVVFTNRQVVMHRVSIIYDGGYDPIPLEIQSAISDLVVSRYYNRHGDNTKIVRSENVPDVGSVDYTVSMYYQKGFDPLLGMYGTLLDMYRTERSYGLAASELQLN